MEDPALRDALEHFDTALITPICDRTRRRATTGLPETFLFGWGTTFFDVVSTITKQADQARPWRRDRGTALSEIGRSLPVMITRASDAISDDSAGESPSDAPSTPPLPTLDWGIPRSFR